MSNQKNSGLGVGGTLLLIFIVLKLTNLINWSWWLVFMPVWVILGLCVILFIFYLIIYIIKALK